MAGWRRVPYALSRMEPQEPPDEPITQFGDFWILGDHRLLCGDSSKPEDVDRLLAGDPGIEPGGHRKLR